MQSISRRELLRSAAAGVAAMTLPMIGRASAHREFTLPPLPYAYDALEPHIDAETMKIHHDLHHKAYVDNLNKALMKAPDWAAKPIDEILRSASSLPQDIRQAVINNGGGHYNHSMFWEIMGPNGGGKPSGELAAAIDADLGGFEKLVTDLNQAAVTRFGSGWGWLVLDKGKLRVLNTVNQDCPLMTGTYPVMGIDVWEHAYYLKYRNRRPEYLKAWWNVVNWSKVADRFAYAKKKI